MSILHHDMIQSESSGYLSGHFKAVAQMLAVFRAYIASFRQRFQTAAICVILMVIM